VPRQKRRKRKTSRKKPAPGSVRRWTLPLLVRGTALLLLILTCYVVYLDYTVRSQFEGKRWALPARVYARPLELFNGQQLSRTSLLKELEAIGYRKDSRLSKPGSYWRNGNNFQLVTRKFVFWDGAEPARKIAFSLSDSTVTHLRQRDTGGPLDLARLEPIRIGGIYPAHKEDRLLVQRSEVPAVLVDALLAVEDRDFYEHYGVVPSAILRAAWVNIKAGKTVQGGSTITQQLVKNFFLTNQRSLVRKANEAIMALLLEWHYDKDEILEAYLNEVYLGQAGQRAIHGFGMASRFYFGRPLNELNTSQLALLVGIIKGPSWYDPRRHPERARDRRDLVLSLLHDQGKLSKKRMQAAQKHSLQVIPKPRTSITDYPAYLDLVRRQLRRDYRDEDLRSEGMQIFTSFDPYVQWQAEKALQRRVKQLERQRKLKPGKLQVATVITSPEQGEVLAVIGGREPRQGGFNRALDAVRPIGSLMKPAVYLAALEQGYTLASKLDDSPLTLKIKQDERWSPANYDRKYHGQVMLHDALVHSYNVSTVRLGLDIGMDRVAESLQRLGVNRKVHRYPSLSLGTAAFAPVEVSQMYQTFAANGFYSPLRAIREVLDANGKALQRYPLTVEQAFEPDYMYLINTTLQSVITDGTGRSLNNIVPRGLNVAGKTGTTDDLRDSWFAGFTGSHVAVVWVGLDDNGVAGLTGASGAMRIWGDMMAAINTQPLLLARPETVQSFWIDETTGLLGSERCEQARVLPFIRNSEPDSHAECAGGVFSDTIERVFDFFGSD